MSPRCLVPLALAVACSTLPYSSATSPADAGRGVDAGNLGDVEQPSDTALGVGGGSFAACQDLAKAFCARLEHCRFLDFASFYGTLATCSARETLRCTTLLAAPYVNAPIAKVTACAQAMPTTACDAIPAAGPPPCWHEPGKLLDGHPCGADVQCQSGRCKPGGKGACGTCAPAATCSPPGTPVQGQCLPPSAEKGSCQQGRVCGWGLRCAQGVCEKALGPGAKCQPGGCDRTQGLDCHKTDQTCQVIVLGKPKDLCNMSGVSIDLRRSCFDSACANQNDFGQGHCTAWADDGAACTGWEGPFCRPPAQCVDKVCRIVAPQSCSGP